MSTIPTPMGLYTPILKLAAFGTAPVQSENMLILDSAIGSIMSSGVTLTVPLAGFASPVPAAPLANAPSGINTGIYAQDVNGNWQQYAGIDTASANISGTGPEDPAGTLTWFRRQYFRDNQAATQLGKNAFLSVNHLAGKGTLQTNQDRAIWVQMQNDITNPNTIYGMECLQMEMDIYGAPVMGPAVDGEISTLSLQLQDSHTTNAGAPGFGVNCLRATYYRSSGTWGSVNPTVMNLEFTSSAAVNGGGMTCTGIRIAMVENTNNAPATSAHAIHIVSPSQNSFRYSSTNVGLYIQDYGTNANDNPIYVAGGACYFAGPATIGPFTVANLPVGVAGQIAYATNGRKVGEGAGSGTGVPVYFSTGSWRVYSTDAAVQA